MSLGNRIKSLRKAQNLTQQKLADKVDVSRIYVQALESNRRLPSMKLLQRLAPALNVDVTDLLMDFSEPDKPGRVQLESMLENGELEIWYRSKKLSEQELRRVYRLVEAALDDWDAEDDPDILDAVVCDFCESHEPLYHYQGSCICKGCLILVRN